MPELIDAATFPTTRYQGSKRKILDWFLEVFNELEFDSVLDAFGGTSSVSYLFKRMGKSVVYNDYLKFNHLVGKALIENQGILINDDDIEFILDFSQINNENSFIQDNFKDVYYTDEENEWLDNIVSRINDFQGNNNNETEVKKAMFFYALFQSCLRKRPFNLFHRKNLYIRTNDVKRNFGNKTTWEKDFTSELKYFLNELNKSIFNSETNCVALNENVMQLENNNYDLVYFDPPYVSGSGNTETNNYLKCYHFLEGLTDYDNWSNRIDFATKNLRFKKEDNPFNQNNILNSLALLCENFQDSIIVLSYKIGGTPTIDEIVELMCNFKTNVEVKSKHYVYALNKQNGNAKHNREVLIIGKND